MKKEEKPIGVKNTLIALFVVPAVIILIAAFLTCITGCTSKKRERAKDAAHQIDYIKDTRTGMCFAYYEHKYLEHMGLATVPCEKVRKYITNIPKPEKECSNAK